MRRMIKFQHCARPLKVLLELQSWRPLNVVTAAAREDAPNLTRFAQQLSFYLIQWRRSSSLALEVLHPIYEPNMPAKKGSRAVPMAGINNAFHAMTRFDSEAYARAQAQCSGHRDREASAQQAIIITQVG